MDYDLLRVQQELKGHAYKCNLLIADKTMPASSVERELAVLAQLVEKIPERHSSLAKEWNLKLTTLMDRFSLVTMKRAVTQNALITDGPSAVLNDTIKTFQKSVLNTTSNRTVNLNETIRFFQNQTLNATRTGNWMSIADQLNCVYASIRLQLTMRSPSVVVFMRKLDELMKLVRQIPDKDKHLSREWKGILRQLLSNPMIAPSTSAGQLQHSDLVAELCATEMAILNLLSTASPPRQVVQLKLANLKQLVNSIPTQQTELIDEWNGKLFIILEKGAAAQSTDETTFETTISVLEMTQYIDELDESTISVKLNNYENDSQFTPLSHDDDDDDSVSRFLEESVEQVDGDIESLTSEIANLMNADRPDFALIDDRLGVLVPMIDHLPPGSQMSIRWHEKIVQLMKNYNKIKQPNYSESFASGESSAPSVQRGPSTPVLSTGSVSPTVLSAVSSSKSSVLSSAAIPLNPYQHLLDQQSTIIEMFSLTPLPIVGLHEMVSQFQSSVESLPPTDSKTAEWERHLALFMYQLRSVTDQQTSEAKNVVNPVSSPSLGPTPTETSVNIRAKLTQAFARIRPIPSHIDFEVRQQCLRNLLLLSVKSRKIIEGFDPHNKQLAHDVLTLAFGKLSNNLRSIYLQHYKRKFNYATFILFLSVQLSKSNPELNLYANPYGNYITCHYCRAPGHMKTQCPKIPMVTCFNCFGVGHISKRCTNKPASAEKLLDSIQ